MVSPLGTLVGSGIWSLLAATSSAVEESAPEVAGANVPLTPILVMVLSAVAAIGTLLLMPNKRDGVFRKIGGIILTVVGLILVATLIRYVAGLKNGQMNVFFWVFSLVAVVGAVRVITHQRPVYSALYFVLTIMASAGLFILLWAEFMAAALVIIYAGAILVTYVFVIMLATQSVNSGESGGLGALAEYDGVAREPLIASATGFALMGVLLFVIFDKAPADPLTKSAVSIAATQPMYAAGSVKALGEYLFKNQLVNLELAGMILTISMVGAILIARRKVFIAGKLGPTGEMLLGPATPVDDNPHSIPVYGTDNPRQKAFPET